MGPSSRLRDPGPADTARGRPHPARRLAEIGAVAVLVAELAVLLRRLHGAVDGPAEALWMVPAVLLGVLLTDLVSGVVHWLCDTFGHEATPLVGPLLIAPFREHHRAPDAMTRHGVLRVNHNNCLGIVLVLGAALWLTRPAAGETPSVFGHAFLAAFACAVYWTNTIHRWAHETVPPAVARGLQRAGLALDPHHHARHHAAGRGCYCITTGWMNPLLDRSGLFDALARARGTSGVPRARR